jgi:predicted nucleic acid-binding protein
VIILDTNVISEPMKTESDPAVDAWFDRQDSSTLYLTAVTLAELHLGIARMAESRRKQGLLKSLEITRRRISNIVLPFDETAAIAYSELMARTKAMGFQVSLPDGQIAAIAKVNGFAVATRDVTPFRAAGVQVINPWEDC